MKPYCSFIDCPNQKFHRNRPFESGIVLLTFPPKEPLKQDWIDVIRRQRGDPEWVPDKHSRVCTSHFKPGDVFRNIRGEKKVTKDAVPYFVLFAPDNIKQAEETCSSQEESHVSETHEAGTQDKINPADATVDTQVLVLENKMDDPDKVEMDEAAEILPANTVNPAPKSESSAEGKRETNAMPLDKFKRRLVRAVARHIQEKKPEHQMWKDLKKEIGCDCTMLWQHMRALTLKKLKRLLPANDLLVNLKKIARFTATDWLLFDLILVHEKVNVISINDGTNAEDDNKEEPQCLHDLFELIKEHKVEQLSGDDLIEAWIRVTLQYNSRGRQCSPMLLQLRWYQLKELTRARFYNFWCAYRGNFKLLDQAMKSKPTVLQTAIAREYKHIVTTTYPEWEKLIEQRRVILSEEFTLNRQAKRKAEKPREENDEEIEVIEPEVETIELEECSDKEDAENEEKKLNTEQSDLTEDRNKESTLDIHENKAIEENNLISEPVVKSELDDDVLELDGLSDVETMHIPLEKTDDNQYSENVSDNSIEEIPQSDVIEILPKITNVVGNIVEPVELTDKQEMKITTEHENNVHDAVIETMIIDNQCKDIKDSKTVQHDSDGEMDEILREKANNLMNIEITQIKSECNPDDEVSIVQEDTETIENIQEEDEFDAINDPITISNKLTLCDSDDDIDKILQEKARKFISVTPLETNIEIAENSHIGTQKGSKNIIDNDITSDNLEMDQNDEVDITKEEIHDDGFDDIDIDDDQIEFVDDGIELVEETQGQKKIMELKTEPTSASEDESTMDKDEYPKIDLKLLMNPTVYTKKLDLMNIFKFTDYISVNDKKVIESAILESKPIDKLALKDEDIKKFREQAVLGYETDETQSDGDIVQTSKEDSCNRVKCTSWLLQKPKNRSYNPIQLCKNPDFNTRLKRLTAGFLSSTRNRELLKECKALTIDLHKAFEKKLVNGTMYLKSGDFKSAKATETDKTKENPVSVLQPITSGQSMLFTNPTNNISSVVPNKFDNPEDNIPLSPNTEKNACNERRKIINLPDIDQVRRFNQSLLTAEVTPIRIENKTNETISYEELVKPAIDQDFVEPISLHPLAQIKKERLEFDKDDKNKLQFEDDKPQYEISSRKDVIANKINDQIINLSHQISEVDKNELLSIDVEKSLRRQTQTKNKVGRKPKNLGKPKNQSPVNKLTYVPRFSGKLSWSPKYPKNHVIDSVLTLDTLSKILFLLNGDEEEIKNCSCKQKKGLKEVHIQQQQAQITQHKSEQETLAVNPADLTKCDIAMKSATTDVITQTKTNDPVEQDKNDQESCIIQPDSRKFNNALNARTNQPETQKKRTRKPRLNSGARKYVGIYCCWAREKIISITQNKQMHSSRHACFSYWCRCCCRHELVSWIKHKNPTDSHSRTVKNNSTIVLSDDDDVSKATQNNDKNITPDIPAIPDAEYADKTVDKTNNLENLTATSIVPTETLNKVSIEIQVPSLVPITKTIIGRKSTNFHDKDVIVQSEMPQVNSSIDPAIEKDATSTQKSCKTVVYAADGPAYKKRIETVSSGYQEQNSVTAKSIVDTDEENSNLIKRKLYLNNSQMFNQPTRTPIYLGKNKILLCSLKNTKVAAAPINPPILPVLPYGVNFVMSNGELTLSIDNGIQLDSEQLSSLPALMSLVQEQFLRSNITNNIPGQDIPQENNDASVIKENTIPEEIVTNTVENIDNPMETQNKSTQSNNLVINDNNALTESSNSNLNDGSQALPLNSEVEASAQIKQSEIMSTEPDCLISTKEQQVTKTHVENNITEPESATKNQANISQNSENVLPLTGPPSEDNNDLCENKNLNARKTILSDLMEMSGISAEDTSLVPEVAEPCPSIIPLPPNIIPITRVSGNDTPIAPCNNSMLQNITIAGPYSNLFSFPPTTPINHLLNCVAQLRPDLNAVTSFAELKYVYVNGGQFYKLDVDSGTISEINVLIKKNPKSLVKDMTPKAFIDLTDDACDSENLTCAEFQDIPQDKQEVKPIKLFKAVHPTILNRNHRSILKESAVIYPKKAIRVNKHRRKQLLNVGNRYLLVDVEKELANHKDPPIQTDSSFDSSDEEPLAKKCKRKELAETSVEETIPLFEDRLESCVPPVVSEEIVATNNDIPDVSCEYGDTSDVEMNSMDIEGVNPELHPVAFEEGSESEEDMCILGV